MRENLKRFQCISNRWKRSYVTDFIGHFQDYDCQQKRFAKHDRSLATVASSKVRAPRRFQQRSLIVIYGVFLDYFNERTKIYLKIRKKFANIIYDKW